MALSFDQHHHRCTTLCTNKKRCFLMLLLFNFVFACIYYIHEQTFPSGSFIRLKTAESNSISNTAIKYFRKILEHEYDYQDLLNFYEIVEKEFSLGLPCMRKSISSVIFNETNNTMIKSTTSSIHSSIRPMHRSMLYNYTIVNVEICQQERIDLLIIIISKSENYKTRDAIRRTWGSGKNLGKYSLINMKVFFLVDFDEKLYHTIRLENNLFHDIIQVELPQQYTLVTHRVLSLFEWSFRYCRSAKYIFKTDDDIFINLILLLKFVSPLIELKTNNSFHLSDLTIYGYKHYNPTVFRTANDPVGARYVITYDEYPCSKYPDFLSGFGYLISRKARDALVYAAYHDRDSSFRISDVYLTGILPDYLSISRQSMLDYTIRYQGECTDFFKLQNSFACAAGSHHGENQDVFEKFNRYWLEVKQFL